MRKCNMMMILICVIKNHAHIHHLVKEEVFSLEAKTQIYGLNNNKNYEPGRISLFSYWFKFNSLKKY